MPKRDTLTAVVVGLGGIGSWLLRGLVPLLAYRDWEGEWGPVIDLVLVDGDEYQVGNKSRQLFGRLGKKAEVSADWANKFWGDGVARAVTRYLGTETTEGDDNSHPSVAVGDVIPDGSAVFSCVDNNATRKLLVEHCATLKDVELYSAGNEYDDGNAWLYARKGGKDVTPDPRSYHPELALGLGKRPDQMSCDDLAQSGTPQLVVANMGAAFLLLSLYHARLVGKLKLDFPEVYFDVNKATAAPRMRVVA